MEALLSRTVTLTKKPYHQDQVTQNLYCAYLTYWVCLGHFYLYQLSAHVMTLNHVQSAESGLGSSAGVGHSNCTDISQLRTSLLIYFPDSGILSTSLAV